MRRTAYEVLRSLEVRVARLEERRVENIRFRPLKHLNIDQVVMALGLSYRAELGKSVNEDILRRDLVSLIKDARLGADTLTGVSISINVLDLVSEMTRSYLLASLELRHEGKKLSVQLPVGV